MTPHARMRGPPLRSLLRSLRYMQTARLSHAHAREPVTRSRTSCSLPIATTRWRRPSRQTHSTPHLGGPSGRTWIEILFTQSVATFEAFTGEISKGDVIRPTTPPLLVERFHNMMGEARRLAEQQLTHADDADAHYQVGATAALSALYGATVDGRTLGALTQGRRAVSAMERARERDRGKRETALILGMSQSTISTMSWPMRTLARLSGLSGDRETGLALLREAATQGTETETDALLLLMIVDNREGRPTDALPRLAYLQRLHPRNRLLWLNQAAAALAAGRPHEAEHALSPGIIRHDWDAGPAVLGEIALWFAQRGTARASLIGTRRP